MKPLQSEGRPAASAETPVNRLESLAKSALSVAKTARKHKQSLKGANFYGDKMVALRADAVNTAQQVLLDPEEDKTALKDLIHKVFSSDGSQQDRTCAFRELQFSLKTKWAAARVEHTELQDGGVFPLATLQATKRRYLVEVGKQANGCYGAGWYDGCAVMMRRLLETCIIEAFEAQGTADKIKDPTSGDFFQLTQIINTALLEGAWNLPRNVKKQLPNLRDLGHGSAHNRYYLAQKADIDKFAISYRETVEAFLHIAKLL